MKNYADKVGADLVIIEGYTAQPYVLSNKFRVGQVFDQYGYDRILFVDSDALIRDHCINFFDLVPRDHIGILDEAEYYDEWMLANYRREASALLMSQEYQLDYHNIPSPKNSGLYLLSKSHRVLLSAFKKPFPICSRDGATVEQTWFSLMLHQLQLPIFAFEHPKHHWVWYADPEENETDAAMVLHFAGLHDEQNLRYKRLRYYASENRGADSLSCESLDQKARMPAESFDRQMMLNSSAPAALKMIGAHTISTHRYGWSVAVKAASVLADPNGVIFDGFIESTFLYHSKETFLAKMVPYREPWIGFVHNPPGVPHWPSIAEYRLQNLDQNTMWLDSLPYCLGLFALTEYLATWVREHWGVPCEVLRYPTLTPEKQFSFEEFKSSSEKTIATVGFWLRRFTSFSNLRAGGFRKVRPMLLSTENASGFDQIHAYENDERQFSGVSITDDNPIVNLKRLSGTAYDEFLAKTIIFLDLIDASGVTTIVECIVRGTPLLINRHPAVVEYLGEDYPLYFETLSEAEAKVCDLSLLKAAHLHMRDNPIVPFLTPQSFLNSLAGTSIYRNALKLRHLK